MDPSQVTGSRACPIRSHKQTHLSPAFAKGSSAQILTMEVVDLHCEVAKCDEGRPSKLHSLLPRGCGDEELKRSWKCEEVGPFRHGCGEKETLPTIG